MKLVLKEEPREWRKFMLQLCGLVVIIMAVFAFRGMVGWLKVAQVGVAALVAALAAWLQPQWFRLFYRGSMIFSAWLGARMSKVVLTVLFVAAFIPLAFILKLCRHDPLLRHRVTKGETYWRPVQRRSRLDRMY